MGIALISPVLASANEPAANFVLFNECTMKSLEVGYGNMPKNIQVFVDTQADLASGIAQTSILAYDEILQVGDQEKSIRSAELCKVTENESAKTLSVEYANGFGNLTIANYEGKGTEGTLTFHGGVAATYTCEFKLPH